MRSLVLRTRRSEPNLIPLKLTNLSQANANRAWRIQLHCVVNSSIDLERLVDYVLYTLFYTVILLLFVYSLVLQTMWEALCKGISRFKFINKFKQIFISCANKNNLKLVSAIFYQIFIFSSNDSPSKTMKNVFYFIEKALFVLKIFKLL